MGSYLSSEQSPDNQDDYEEENTQRLNSQRMDIQTEALNYPTPERCRKPYVTILTEILREKAKLNEKLMKENNAILQEFLEGFIQEMKKNDKVFSLLFQRIYFTGSYYSDLRVSTPDEYDLNLVLKFPFKSNSVKVEYNSQVPSYAKYSTTDQSGITRENGLSKLFDNGYLIPNKVRTWLQSVVDKTLTNYKNPRNVVKIRPSASGPARTITLIKRDGSVIDIDLVPAIECSIACKPPGIQGPVYEKVKNKLQCFLVPKPYQPTNKQAPVNEAERARLWRTHYPNAENDLIHNIGCVKPVIKLLKLLRDKENWKILASYYLKTVIMWKILENSNSDYWKMDHIGDRLLDALEKLSENVKDRKICYLFSSRYNLLEKLSDQQAFNIHNRLRGIIKDIRNDPRNLWNIFGCEPTFRCVL